MNLKQKGFVFILLIITAVTASCTVVLPVANKADDNGTKTVICNYDIPDGYSEQFIVSVGDLHVTSLIGQEESSHIYLVGLPEEMEIDSGNSANDIGVLVNRKEPDRIEMHTVENQIINIHGQQVNLIIREGENSNHQLYREATAVFQSDYGKTLVNISSTITNWDQQMVSDFLASLN